MFSFYLKKTFVDREPGIDLVLKICALVLAEEPREETSRAAIMSDAPLGASGISPVYFQK